MMQIPKKLAVIQDLSGYGRCSLTVALPVVSAMGVQACPVPTSVFSNHTGFPTYSFTDLTDEMPGYLHGWQELSLQFHGILSGFLSSTAQADAIKDFFLTQKKGRKPEGTAAAIILVDPVLGDHGKTYRTITSSLAHSMKELVSLADIISPNITEACLLTDTPYQESFTKEQLFVLSGKLHRIGPSRVVITGMKNGASFLNYSSEARVNGRDRDTFLYVTEAAGESRPGTGDIFASILAADAVKGTNFFDSVKKAADFVRTCTEASAKLSIPVAEGVCFENFLSRLC